MNKQDSSSIASPEGALSFLFGIFTLMMWYVALFPPKDPPTLFSIGLMWLVLSTGAMIASLINLIRGSDRGNTNLLATVLLGFLPGINTLVTWSAVTLQLTYKPVVVGVVYLIGSFFCFGAAISRWDKPTYIWLRIFSIAVGFLLVGFGDLLTSQSLMVVGGWFLFLYAMLSFYYGLSKLYPLYGFTLPQGSSLKAWLRRDQA